MNFEELRDIAIRLYRPALYLERIVSRSRLKSIERFLRLIFILFLIIGGAIVTTSSIGNIEVAWGYRSLGAASLAAAAWLLSFAFLSFFNSYFFRQKSNQTRWMDFQTASLIYQTSTKDILASLFSTSIGRLIIFRAGIDADTFKQYLNNRQSILDSLHFHFSPVSQIIGMDDVVTAIFDCDESLQKILFSGGIRRKELGAIVDWIAENESSVAERDHWWSKDRLSRIQGIGRDWSYGQVYNLEKFQKYLPRPLGERYSVHSSYGVEELRQLETVLSRSRGANALLVGDDDAGKISIVGHLAAMIDEGEVSAQLKHKRVIVLDTDAISASFPNKAEFESELSIILNEAERAGNVMLVVENFPTFIQSAMVIGSDISSLLGSFLSSSHIQFIALSDNARFHESIEPNAALMQHFERIFIKGIDENNTVKVLENEIVQFENRGVFFTYPALLSISESAERYFSDGVMPDKAVDLLLEVVPKLQAEGKNLVEKSDVLRLVEQKTGIPTGQVTEAERDKLLNLEKILHDRVIGQDAAIGAIANAVRRARSGIESPDRPMGSFLFLGPTGVGKTETTKALAQIFFGDESHIMRLDMSEYSSQDSVSKLIGSFEGRQTGVLSTMLREHPYGVLLLDEFEKTTKEVMNLFLQVLDEGFFSDMTGKKINARNLIIIATSNAGADMIWKAAKEGKDPAEMKDEIIDAAIAQGIFKPELLNRFDGVIVFHPLSLDHLRKIATLMLSKLKKRLAEKGMDLVINDPLVDFLVSQGSDPQFGARPLNRAIEDTIEQVISKKIISGSVRPGMQIALTPDDLK